MGNSLSKLNDKPFTFYMPPLTSGHLKKVASSIRKNPVKYFASGAHRNHGYIELTQNIKSSLMDVYDRFPPQSCYMSMPNSLKKGVILKGTEPPFLDIF